ncbi:MIH1 [[Candida] subhashii]|uniref:M-phase inducer phosphatase n=1 Tax=[Candida] subhashii TaxID=561895 RepID=A0A8J5QFT7_9ASCO|nr:MIH1 [[Candida] subhashii]KAG7663681.1 MIH1 [[Candida] subhashii]
MVLSEKSTYRERAEEEVQTLDLHYPPISKGLENREEDPELSPTIDTQRYNNNDQSPLFNRRPFRNISNLMLPSAKAFSSSTNILSKSVNAVSISSQQFFSSLTLGSGHRKDKLDTESEIETDYDEYEEEDEDEVEDFEEDSHDDTFETINVGSPIPRKHLHKKTSSTCMLTVTKESNHFVDNSHLKYTKINTFTHIEDSLPRLNEDELYKILSGELENEFDETIIIDCRFNYEFAGGHIINAINISTKEDLEQRFMDIVEASTTPTKKRLLIFHCEFSVFRGPIMARHLRKRDREMNLDSYPYLNFPDIVVLDGGYKRFFDKYRQFCEPQGYVEMKDIRHEKICEDQLNRVRKDSKLTRAKSFQDCNTDNNLDRSFTFGHTKSQSFTHDKIIKRQRSIKQKFSPFDTNRRGSPAASPLVNDYEFPQPPTTSFRKYHHHHQKSYSVTFPSSSTSSFFSTSSSISSTSTSLYSDGGSISSSDSLADPYSSSNETTSSEFESRKWGPASTSTPNMFLRKKSARGTNPTITSFKFPNKTRSRAHTVASEMSSPIISSPLSFQKIDSSIDSINEAPVEFSLKMHQRTSSLLSNVALGSQNMGSLEDYEIEEEDHCIDTDERH